MSRRTAFKRAFARLPELTRRIFRLHRVEGLSYAEISEQLGLDMLEVERHIAAALIALGEALDVEP